MSHSCVDDSDERRIWLYVVGISDQNLGVAVGRKECSGAMHWKEDVSS